MGDMTPIIVDEKAWETILKDLQDRHGQSIIMVSVMKRKLGWTPRAIDRWGQRPKFAIDFWEPSAKSLFLLDYSDKIIG